MEEYGALFARLEALKAEMERASAQGGESAEFLRLRKQLLSLELEITDLRLWDLAAQPRPAAAQPAAPPPAQPAAPPPSQPAPAGQPRYTYRFSPPPEPPRPSPPLAARQVPGVRGRAAQPKPFTWSEPRREAPPRPPKKAHAALSESNIGKYILSLLASLLILLGCCVLILMGWSYMTEPVKAGVIALGGLLFLGGGLALSKRFPKPFADSLTACGLAILYADVIALYQAWALVPLWAVLFLILAWDALCVLLGRRGQTKLFFYVLALGDLVTAALVCQLISNSPLSLISLAFVGCTQAGAIYAFRRQYGRFDPVLAFTAGAAALYLAATHYSTVSRFFGGYQTDPGAWVLACLLLCFALSCLVLWSTGHILGVKPGFGGNTAYLCLTIPVLLGAGLLAAALGHYAWVSTGLDVVEHHLPLVLAALAAVGMLWPSGFRRPAYCVCVPVALWAAESLLRYHGCDAVGAGAVALGTLAVYLRHRERVTETAAGAAYGVALLCLCFSYGRPIYFVAMIPALAFPLALIYEWRRGASKRQAMGVLVSSYAAAFVLAEGVVWQYAQSAELYRLSFLAGMGVLMAALPVCLRDLYQRRAVLRINERIQSFGYEAALFAFTLTLDPASSGAAVRAVAVLLLFLQGLNLLHAAYFRWATGRQFGWGIAAAVCLTANVVQSARLTPAGEWPIFLSLLCIALAVGYIVLGFHREAKPLRIFGLVLSIASVLKMVTLDITGSPSIFRVVALMAGGVLCFAISFVYNRVEQKAARSHASEQK